MNLREINELFADPSANVDDRITADNNKQKVYMTTAPTGDIVLADDNADIVLKTKALVKFTKKINGYHLDAFANGDQLRFNGKEVEHISQDFAVGDQLTVANLRIERRPEQWKFVPLTDEKIELNIDQLLPQTLKKEYPWDFPNFRRSPRIYLRQPEDEVRLQAMPEEKKNSGSAIWGMLIPPIGMVLTSVLMTMLSNGNAGMMIGMGSMSVLTAGYSVSSYFTNKKKIKKENKEATAHYKKYLVDFTAKLDDLNSEQKHVLEYNFPDMERLSQMVNAYDSRIYERLPKNDDFLAISLGHGTLPASYKINYDDNEAKEKRKFEKFVLNNVIVPYNTVQNAPVTIGLKEATLGLVGNKKARNEALQTMLFQIAAFQAYRDVQFIVISSDEDYERYWKEWRWLPHFQIQSLNLRGLVHNAQTRDMVLNSFYQLLVKRRQEVRENKNKDLQFAPQFVLAITDESLLNGSNLNEFLADDMSQYGVTVIWSKDTQSMLPETVNTLVSYNNRQAATLINDENVYLNLDFVPNHYPEQVKLNDAIKRLANLNLVETEKNSIPDSISFLGMYGVKNVEQLQILQRWQKADTSKTLAVPLGLRGKNDVVYLNLHERAHGPHGLIAGTTGSGKSELLQSYILSLAVNFGPEDVGFLPIDYKGGGMANLFNKLPHMLGSITNLDGAGTQRALKSIHAELTKRQRWFSDYHVNNINAYTKLYKKGKTITDPKEKKNYPSKPLPHLFLISDEFAELKANEPDFMDELVSTARIGRSLGVHLILATQKPSGVVNDQIWSNSKFKIALKVSEPADSKEILHTPDAASITQPGRAYLQVGNNEIYELFQSAWSGATYNPESDDKEKVDQRIWLINHLGQAQLLTNDLSEEETESSDDEETQLDAVIGEIAHDSKEIKLTLPDKPWLPELAKEIDAPEVDWKKEWQGERRLSVPFGMLDIPTQQKQTEFKFDLEKFNPAVILGSAGYGKSTALQELVLSLSRYNNPEQVQFNLLDFGNNGLLPLAKLPHVADIVTVDETEKFHKMLQIINNTMDTRKAMFQEQGVSNYEQYEATTKTTLPVIVNVLDAYDAISESPLREVIDAIITRILREGQALGIFLVMSSNRLGVFRISMQSNLNKKLALYLVDEDDIREIYGRDALLQSPVAGRGQVELDDEIEAFQVYNPIAGTNSLQVIENIGKLAKEMDKTWQGNRPKAVPMLPLEFDYSYLEQDRKQDTQAWWDKDFVPMGFDIESTNVLGFVPEKHHFFTLEYYSAAQAGILEYNVIKSLDKINKKKYIVDFNDDYSLEGFTQIGDQPDDIQAIKAMMADYATSGLKKEKKQEIYIYVPDLEEFIEKTAIDADSLKVTLQYAWRAGMYLIFRGNIQYLEKQFGPVMNNFRDQMTAGMVTTKLIDTNLIKTVGRSSEPELKENEAYLFDDKGLTYFKVRIAKN